jgi:polysaccharide export outer membrane protein
MGFGLVMVGLTFAAPQAHAASYRVSPGDVLQITIWAGGEKQQEFSAMVSDSGAITCPLIGGLALAGMAPAAVAEKMKALLSRDYFVDPQVLVAVKEYGGKVYVLGEVKHPGIYPVTEGLTALGVCAVAGGFSDFAAPRRARIARLRDGKPEIVHVDLVRVKQGKAEDPVLRGGDRLDIPRRWF